MTTESFRWFTSSYSGNGGQCVEVATNLVAAQDVVAVRDSKDPEGPSFSFPTESFASFVRAVRDGEFGARE